MAWFRIYEGMSNDAKFHLIARKSGQPVAFAIAVWMALLERASAAANRGDVEGFDCESCDAALGMPDGATQAIYAAMEAKGMIVDNRIARWDERQPMREDDNSTARVQRFRAKRKAAEDETACNEVKRDETQCNAMKRCETQCNEVKRDETPDKIRGEENIKNLNINLNTASGGDENLRQDDITASPSGAAEFSHAVQKAKGKKQKGRAPDPPLLERIIAAANQEAQARDGLIARGQTPKWPQGWLAGRRWEDYEPPEKPPQIPGQTQEKALPSRQTDENWQKAQQTRLALEAERQAKRLAALTGHGPEEAAACA